MHTKRPYQRSNNRTWFVLRPHRFSIINRLTVVEMLIVTALIIGLWREWEKYSIVNHHLGTFQWYFQSANGSIRGHAYVPGDIYQDLFNANTISEPLFGDNDRLLRWVPRMNWIYHTALIIPENWSRMKAVLLNVRGLDTVAEVYFNDILVLKARNQFVSYLLPLKRWKVGTNLLRIEFTSPVNYSAQRSDKYQKQYGHILPPFCPVSEFQGECHVNFMRKIQASFSWDWGPSFPTVGISEPLYIEGVETMFIEGISAAVSFKKQFIVSVKIMVWSAVKADAVLVTLALPELSIKNQFNTSLNSMRRNIIKRKMAINDNSVERWWPNGSGEQRLYNLTAYLSYKGYVYSSKVIRVGFRTVELIQDYVKSDQPALGRHFYFKINGRSIFLKGSNWIPVSAFPARNHRLRETFLLESAHEANMNTLRVWGGGRYESDHFYDLADELGLLIWQDMMFACALYPVDRSYLDSVQDEVQFQVDRLRHHPSIFLWAGNNENELAVRHWFHAENYSSTEMIADYMKLYNKTVKPIIDEMDGTRPYLLSSPTNGIESEKEGGVAGNPEDDKYGDIHFYSESTDLWNDKTYHIPRCSSEYGVQSFSRKETMLKYLNESDWFYTSERMRRRQHHPGGFFTQLSMIFSHFRIPDGCEEGMNENCAYLRTTDFMDRFVYLSQFHQAVAYQVQTEHYRRWRGRFTPDGRGNTMCALYWQLNDLWAAPTWSTIDFELSWKPAHYFARRFFAPVILSVTVNEKVHLFVVSDLIVPILQATVVVELYSWLDGFTPVFSYNKTVTIPPQSSSEIQIDGQIANKIREDTNKNLYLLRGIILSSNGTRIGYDMVHLPSKLFKIPDENFGEAQIQKFQVISRKLYEVELVADKIAPFVYLELTPGLVGWFSDNAFTMVEEKKTVMLTLFNEPEYQLTSKNVTVCTLRNCGITK